MFFDDGRKGQWKKLQEDLNFDWIEGFDELTQHQKIGSMILAQMGSKDYEKLKSMLNNPLMKMMGKLIDIYGMYGQYKDHDIVIFPGTSTSNSSSSSGSRTIKYTHIGLILDRELPFNFKIERKGFFAKIFKPKITYPNNEELNKLIKISGDNKEMIESHLNDSKKAEALKSLFINSKGFTVDNVGIRYKQQIDIIPQNELIPLLDLMTKAGEAF